MKRLTVIASILLLPTFIVGLYGQNFITMPELSWQLRLRLLVGADHRHDGASGHVLPTEELALALTLRPSIRLRIR